MVFVCKHFLMLPSLYNSNKIVEHDFFLLVNVCWVYGKWQFICNIWLKKPYSEHKIEYVQRNPEPGSLSKIVPDKFHTLPYN